MLPLGELSTLYDDLYQHGEEILKKYNPCKIADGKCAFSVYYDVAKERKLYFCCQGCEHVSTTGCTVKALSCKLWLCSHASIANSECYNKLKRLQEQARRADIPMYVRLSKAQVFSQLAASEQYRERLKEQEAAYAYTGSNSSRAALTGRVS